MVELFEPQLQGNQRHSSKGNQLKWEHNGRWYKADYTGYEGLAEYLISELLALSNLATEEYVRYAPEQMIYGDRVFCGASSPNFLRAGWQIITLERLVQTCLNQSLSKLVWAIHDEKKRLEYLVAQVERLTGIKNFGVYMNKVLTIDALFLNEDRHMHNLAVLMDGNGAFALCPLFDHGAGLLADTTLDYPEGKDVYELMKKVKGKTFCTSLDTQVDASEELYGRNLRFRFTKKDVERLLGLDGTKSPACIYPPSIRERVADIIFSQMRKYAYLFES